MAGRGGGRRLENPLPSAPIPNPPGFPVGTPQGAEKSLGGSQLTQPRMSPDLSPAAPLHKRADGGPEPSTASQGPGRLRQSGEKEEDEERHRQKQQPGPGLAQAQPHAAGFMQGENWGDTAGKPPQSQVGVPHFPQTSPSPSFGVPTCYPAPSCPGWVFLCSVGAGRSACGLGDAG